MDDRRQFKRHAIHVALSISTDDLKDRAGITRDVSAGGLLFHSSTRFAIGDRVDVMFRIARSTKTQVTGEIVRVFQEPDYNNVFRNISAVAFAFPLTETQLALA